MSKLKDLTLISKIGLGVDYRELIGSEPYEPPLLRARCQHHGAEIKNDQENENPLLAFPQKKNTHTSHYLP